MTAKTTYLALLRGINVGGKNKVPMAGLKKLLEEIGLEDVSTYIQSGNAMFRSSLAARTIARMIEEGLTATFKLDDALVKVLVLSRDQLKAVVDKRPKGFGDEPDKFHSDAIFLMEIDGDEALAVFKPRDGVDKVWPGEGVIYSQRLSAERTKSRLGRIVASPLYKSMTIRSWQTTQKLLELLGED
ncbi:DUF1697 domain-containing protein [Devosia sp. ZB163]|uniref:DUF1697 domain-containing protein n=1 Tax=Devosia sp. ZB163 TaxID=3025938 RepID=UPI00235ED0AC|nr:DUF1697 domain-containing protein [Devosia sp. ZB163]MDC9823433.1 DUF1697 domain-containing protein [Devosia sp. ZB163]